MFYGGIAGSWGGVDETAPPPPIPGLLVEWTPIEGSYGYELYMRPDASSDWVLIAANARSNTYLDTVGVITNYYQVKSLDRFGVAGLVSEPFRMYDIPDSCRVYGYIMDVNGNPTANSEIELFVAWDDLPRFVQERLVSGKSYLATTNELGIFEVHMPVGLLATIHVKLSRFKCQFMVPNQASVDIKDLVGTFGVLTDVENPF